MPNTPDGGPAFPFPDPQGPALGAMLGMSLRDWFAGQAMAFVGQYMDGADCPKIAALSYELADAMLAAREK